MINSQVQKRHENEGKYTFVFKMLLGSWLLLCKIINLAFQSVSWHTSSYRGCKFVAHVAISLSTNTLESRIDYFAQ